MTLLEPLSTALADPTVLVILAASYLSGSVPYGLLLARVFGKTDVRTKGSGNIGATNVARVVGKKLGVLTLVLDAIKAAVPVIVAGVVLPSSLSVHVVQSLAGLMAFLGHCFPLWLRFRGGKGVATGAGFVLAFAPVPAAIGLSVFALTFAAFRMVSLGSLVAALVTLGVMAVQGPRDASFLCVLAMVVILVAKHRSNIERILGKKELQL